MNEKMTGKWTYRSFRHDPIVIKNGKVDGNPDLAIPWAPPGQLVVNTDATGKVTGTLTFAPGVALTVTGHINPATATMPASLAVTGEGLTSVYQIKGFFIPGSDHIVGTVLCTANDLAKQPVGTEGPFVLYPAKP